MQQPTTPQPTRKHKEPVTDKKAGKKRKAEEQDVPSHKTKKPLFIGKGEDDVDLESLIPNVEERKPLKGVDIVLTGQFELEDEEKTSQMNKSQLIEYRSQLGKEELKTFVFKAGGALKSAVSGKTDILVLGNLPGQSKILAVKKANKMKKDGEHVAIVTFRTFVDLCKNDSGASLLKNARKEQFDSCVELSNVPGALQEKESHTAKRQKMLSVAASIQRSQDAAASDALA